MRSKSLIYVYARYLRQSQTLTSRFLTKLPTAPRDLKLCEPVHKNGRAYLVISLQHLWGQFCRELILRSALGRCETRTGRRLARAPSIKRVRDIPLIAKVKLSGPESHWEDPTFALRVAQKLQVGNYNEISLGLGSVSTHLTNLKSVRNYIVHPSDQTGKKYVQMTRSNGFIGLPPDQLLHHLLPGGATVFDTWSSDLVNAAWNAVS